MPSRIEELQTDRRCRIGNASISKSSPRIEFSGVRSSWLTRDRKSLLTWFA